MKKINLLLYAIAFMLNGCGEANDMSEIYFESKEVKVSVVLSKVEKDKNANYSVIYGKIALTPQASVKNYVDLSCFQLGLGSETTSNIYIDSVASFNPERMLLNQDGKLDYKVHWNIDKQVETEDLRRFSIVKVKENCLY